MRKYRVVIRAFTLRRDIASAELLARFLKLQGCDVIVASCRDFSRTLRYWKPDAVIVNVVGNIQSCIDLAPSAAIVLLPGEGANDKKDSTAVSLKSRPGLFDKLSLVLSWSKVAEGYYKELFSDFDHSKVVVCGNPRLDFVKYNLDINSVKFRNKTIGFIGRYPSINRYDAAPTIRSLQTPEKREIVIWQVENFICMITLIHRILAETNLNISVRPHPLEAPENYGFMIEEEKFKGRVSIDDSFDLVDWLSKQRVVVMPYSSSFFEPYLMRVPIINVDRVTGYGDLSHELTSLASLSQDVAYFPNSYDEVMDLIKREDLEGIVNEKMERYLEQYHHWSSEESAIKHGADAIMAMLNKRDKKIQCRLPKLVIDLVDRISFNRIYKHNPLHANFNYHKHFHRIPEYYNNIFNNIIAGKSVSEFTNQDYYK